MNEHTNQLH